MKPFLKWAGNKYRLSPIIIPLLPQAQRLVEPFAGTAAIFLNTDYPSYLLGEQNKDLVNLYQILQKEGPNFIDECRQYFKPDTNTPETYYAIREKFNETRDLRVRSALFLYLNKHGYNGLCRYNSKGLFNVPFGRSTSPHFPEEEILFFFKKSQQAEFVHADFRQTLSTLKIGDVVYADPPYVPLSKTAFFSSYTETLFTENDHIALAECANTLSEQGIPVIVSNHDTPWTRNHYSNATILSLEVQRHISCKATLRKKAIELIAVFNSKL